MYPLKENFDVFMCFEHFVAMAKNISKSKVGTLWFDQGGKYMSKEFNEFLAN